MRRTGKRYAQLEEGVALSAAEHKTVEEETPSRPPPDGVSFTESQVSGAL